MINIKNELLKAIKNEMEEYNDCCYNSNIIDICDCLAVLEQHLGDKKHHSMLCDLKYKPWDVNVCKPNADSGREATIFINMVDVEEYYYYKIVVYYEERYLGFCECEEGDEGYNPKYKCCGEKCDWFAPVFEVEKIINYGINYFKGNERDLWEFKDIYEKEQREKMTQEQNEKEKRELKYEISELKRKLKDLEEKYKNME